MKRLLAILSVLVPLSVFGQEEQLKVHRFSASPITDIRAQIAPVLDNNQKPAALIEVSIFPQDLELSFQGIIGQPKHYSGSWMVYVPEGTRKIRLMAPGCRTVDYVFDKELIPKSGQVYLMNVELEQIRRWRTLVMPVYALNSDQQSWGLMLGRCKRIGGYTKFTYDFRFNKLNPFEDYLLDGLECDADGFFEKDGKKIKGWFTGDEERCRVSFTGGYMHQLFETRNHTSLYAYLGGGFGVRKLVWTSIDGNGDLQRVQVGKPYSFSGLELECGAIFRLKDVALTLGMQTNQFHYFEATIGVGLML